MYESISLVLQRLALWRVISVKNSALAFQLRGRCIARAGGRPPLLGGRSIS